MVLTKNAMINIHNQKYRFLTLGSDRTGASSSAYHKKIAQLTTENEKNYLTLELTFIFSSLLQCVVLYCDETIASWNWNYAFFSPFLLFHFSLLSLKNPSLFIARRNKKKLVVFLAIGGGCSEIVIGENRSFFFFHYIHVY